LITAVKMETRHRVEGSFGNELSSICNHCGVMAALSRKTLKKNRIDFLRFFCKKRPKNDPLRENFQNSVRKGFIATLIAMLCSNFVIFG